MSVAARNHGTASPAIRSTATIGRSKAIIVNEMKTSLTGPQKRATAAEEQRKRDPRDHERDDRDRRGDPCRPVQHLVLHHSILLGSLSDEHDIIWLTMIVNRLSRDGIR